MSILLIKFYLYICGILGSEVWCDHWKQCVWFIPNIGLSVHKDDYVHLHAIHTDVSLSYEVKTQSQSMEVSHYKLSAQDCQLFLSPERIAIYGDNNWRCSMLKAINDAVRSPLPSPALIYVLALISLD